LHYFYRNTTIESATYGIKYQGESGDVGQISSSQMRSLDASSE